MVDPLTRRQKEILDFIVAYTEEHDLAPTHDEIAERFGISKPTAFEHVKALADKGRLTTQRYRSRSIQLANDAAGVAAADTAAANGPTTVRGAPDIPVVGRVAAGRPIEAVAETDPQQLMEILPASGCFALEVRGDSMIDDQIRDGDFVVLERRKEARNGETVVALIDGQEATLKRWRRVGRDVRLEPRNPNLTATVYDASRIEVCGVLVGLVRRY